jgi:hypothetical protein
MIEAMTYKKNGITISVGDILPFNGGAYVTSIYKPHSTARWEIKFQPFSSEYVSSYHAARITTRLQRMGFVT